MANKKGGIEGRQDWSESPGGKEIPVPLEWKNWRVKKKKKAKLHMKTETQKLCDLSK